MGTTGGRVLRIAIFAGGAWICGIGLEINRRFYHDDPYIGLRYARHLVSGYGPVWNIGERVEGYTNGLFTLLEGALGVAGLDLVNASRWINLSAFLGLVLFAWLRAPGSPARDIGEHFLATFPGFLV